MAKRKQLTPEQEKEIKLLQANNEMYNRTLEEAKIRGNEDAIERIKNAHEEVKKQLKQLENGDNTDTMLIEPVNGSTITDIEPVLIEDEKRSSIYEILENNRKEEENRMIESKTTTATEREIETPQIKYGSELVNPTETTFNDVDNTAQYDIISLPSNGECYKNKMSRVPVGYLTAYDENIITSPNLYRDGLVIDYLLKHKVMNKNINVDELISGDVDAIILFLRATSYGVDFPIIVNDPESGERIETNVDLTTLKTKDFTLKGDENGHFSFKLPKCGAEIKFKYLTRREENDLMLLTRLENKGTVVGDLKDVHKVIDVLLKDDTVLSSIEKASILDANRKIAEWTKKVEERYVDRFNKVITNRMEMQITAVNGDYNRDNIRKFIYNMNASDSLALRKYITANEPGIDFQIEVQRPESLGGGSFKTFLEWNDNVFFNIA